MKTKTVLTFKNKEGQPVILTKIQHNNKVTCFKHEPESPIPNGNKEREISASMYEALIKHARYTEVSREFARG